MKFGDSVRVLQTSRPVGFHASFLFFSVVFLKTHLNVLCHDFFDTDLLLHEVSRLCVDLAYPEGALMM